MKKEERSNAFGFALRALGRVNKKAILSFESHLPPESRVFLMCSRMPEEWSDRKVRAVVLDNLRQDVAYSYFFPDDTWRTRYADSLSIELPPISYNEAASNLNARLLKSASAEDREILRRRMVCTVLPSDKSHWCYPHLNFIFFLSKDCREYVGIGQFFGEIGHSHFFIVDKEVAEGIISVLEELDCSMRGRSDL